MDKNRIQGSLHEVKGAAKQTIGKAIGNRSLIAEGNVERIAGKFQKTLGAMNEAVRNLMKRL